MVSLYRRRYEHYGHGPADRAIVGLGGQVFMRPDSQAAIREFRPYFDHAPVYGGGPSLEDYMSQTPLTVGSPQQVIDRTMGFREIVGDYQRQLFLIDHAGLPPQVALEQLDMLGEPGRAGPPPRVRGPQAGARARGADPREPRGRPGQAAAGAGAATPADDDGAGDAATSADDDGAASEPAAGAEPVNVS